MSSKVRIFKPGNSTRVRPAWITLIGPDAQDFLHRITTVNVKHMGLGQGANGCLLTAQGKIRSFFTLWSYAPQSYGFEIDDGVNGKWKKDLLEAIDQFTFAEKFTVTEVKELETRWIFIEEGQSRVAALRAFETMALDDEIRLCCHGDLDFGRTWISAWGRTQRLDQWVEREFAEARPLTFEELENWRVLSLRPRVDQEITDAVMPLEVGLRESIAQNKGCYPGQEVIEKIISLGAPPRRLARIEGTGPAPGLGEKILNLAETPVEVGQVTSITHQQNDHFSVLGILKKIHAKEGLLVRFSEAPSQGAVTEVAPYV